MNPVRVQAIAELTAAGQPYELQTQVLKGRKLRTFANAPASLRVLFESTASDLSCITYLQEHWSFAQAWAAAARIGHVLVHDCGVRPGDRVAISMRNYPEWMLAFNAATSVGAVAVAMNAHWQSDEMAYACRTAAPRYSSLTRSGWTGWPPAAICLACRCWRSGRAGRWPPACATWRT